jgi:outer membrane lipoprotein SlyB
MTKARQCLPVFCLGLGLAACAAPEPVLYPNTHYDQVGEARARQDTDSCMQMAEDAGATPADSGAAEAAKGTAGGGAVGAAAGAVGGAIGGGVGRGAMIGAGVGATAGLLRSLFRRPQPSSAYVNFVNRCLADRGYETVGWD